MYCFATEYSNYDESEVTINPLKQQNHCHSIMKNMDLTLESPSNNSHTWKHDGWFDGWSACLF